MDTNLTQKIMSQIATEEESRLKKVMEMAIPILFFLLSLMAISFYRLIAGLIEKGVLDIIAAVEYDWNFFNHQLPQVLIWIWELVEKRFLLMIILLIVTLAVFVSKTKVISFPRRFREIAKYR